MDIHFILEHVRMVLTHTNIKESEIPLVNLIVIVGFVGTVFAIVAAMSKKCSKVSCSKIGRALEKADAMEKKLSDLERMVGEIKNESGVAHDILKSDLARFERYIGEIQKSAWELKGILTGGVGPSKSSRRIIHED